MPTPLEAVSGPVESRSRQGRIAFVQPPGKARRGLLSYIKIIGISCHEKVRGAIFVCSIDTRRGLVATSIDQATFFRESKAAGCFSNRRAAEISGASQSREGSDPCRALTTNIGRAFSPMRGRQVRIITPDAALRADRSLLQYATHLT